MSEHIVGVEPTVYNGKKYRSKLEAKTAEALDKMGIPWEYETKTYTLLEGFHCPWQKRKVIAIDYTPDFIIGPIMIEMKGWKTPDFKLKEKMFYKYLNEHEPDAIYYIAKNQKQLLEVLDKHWSLLGYCIEVTSKPQKNKPVQTHRFSSIAEALAAIHHQGKSYATILRSFTGEAQYVFGYNFKLVKITL